METIKLKHNEILILSGTSSSGKSTLASAHFKSSQVLSSDFFRTMVSDESVTKKMPEKVDVDQDYERFERIIFQEYKKISEDAFDLLKETLKKRAKNNRLTVIDATSLYAEDIQAYAKIAKENHVPISIVFLNIPYKQVIENDAKRENARGNQRIKRQQQLLKRLMNQKKSLDKAGIREIYDIQSLDNVHIEIENPQNIISIDKGIDIIGDGHGLLQTRIQLFKKAGYVLGEDGLFRHPNGRKIVYVNDETSRGFLSSDEIKYGRYPSIAMMVSMKEHVEANLAYAVDSNHNYKIWRWLEGRNVTLAHGDEKVEEEFEAFAQEFGEEKTLLLKKELAAFLKSLPSHVIIEDRGFHRAVVTHAGIKDDMIGKFSREIRDFCRFGPTDGLEDSGKPKRLDWTKEHKNGQLIIWGHEPHPNVTLENDTINVDTGGFCGHYLSMLRYPEMDILQEKNDISFVEDENNPILKQKKKRFEFPNLSRLLYGFDLQTSFGTFRAGAKNVQSVIESVSTRMAPFEEVFYVPPTMSPTPKTSSLDDFLEHPQEAFDYYKNQGITRLVCEKKHMGSRAYITLFKNKQVGERYFNRPSLGSILSRNNIKFFKKEEEEIVLTKLNEDLQPYFDEMNTDLLVIDAEILPWNLKASGLITKQYGLTSNAAIHKRKTHVERLLSFQETRSINIQDEIDQAKHLLENAEKFHKAFTYYCWDNDVRKLEGIKIAPFHILAFSHKTNFDENHVWHMVQGIRLAELSDLMMQTEHKVLDLNDEHAVKEITRWWLEMTAEGHEGMVIKPLDFISYNQHEDIIQPAIKVRGREYLRIIYGMDYLDEENLSIIKKRSASKKMKNALNEFKLSMESIQRFIDQESISRIHECVVASLSYENEKLDPRL
jgi:polynucleotide kinase-phosphatase